MSLLVKWHLCVAFAIYLLDRFGTLDDDNIDNDKEKKIIDD